MVTLISTGASGKSDIKPFFEEHVHEIDHDLTIHSADLNHAVIPGDFHAFNRHGVFCFFFTGFNLNQSQSGTASTKAGGDNAK
jgi:hypothetical protein